MDLKTALFKTGYRANHYLKKNGSTILTILGVAGVVGTAIMAAKDSPKAKVLLDDAELEKDESLTFLEKVQVAGPVYIPTIIIGVSTIGCIFGANILNARKQEAIVGAYIMVDNAFKEYKKKVKELYGDDADLNVRKEIVKDKYKPTIVSEGKILFCEETSGHFFESTLMEVVDAEYQYNRMYSLKGEVKLSQFYELLNIPLTIESQLVGYCMYQDDDAYAYSWIDFEHIPDTLQDETPYYIISMPNEPNNPMI